MQTTVMPQMGEHISAAVTEKLREELEMVAYVASHDLQSPLRVIQSCCGELSALSDPAARDSVETLRREALRMKMLMQGLLDYIRLETFVPKHAPHDSNALVADAVAMLDTEIKAANATIRCDSLPQVTGHRGRLTRLFSHLLDNALKFRGANAPDIHISAQQQGAQWEFCIADNGIGIDEEHHDIMFRLFQRLHTEEAYPGYGIGLALSRKIVEAHGGTLWVESATGQGSTFRFTLPGS